MARRSITIVLVLTVLFAVSSGLVWWTNGRTTDPPWPSDPPDLDPQLAAMIEEVRAELRFQSDSGPLWGRLGMIYQANGLVPQAISCYERATGFEPDEARWPFLTAMCQIELNERAAAARSLEIAAERQPRFSAVFWRHGLLLLETGESEEAAKLFRRSMVFAEREPFGWWGMARAELQRGAPEQAVELLKRWLDRSPADRYAHQLLGTALRQIGESDEAEEHFMLGHAAAPGWSDTWTDSIREFVATPGAVLKEGMRLISEGNFEKAARVLQPLRERTPDDVLLLNNLALAYIELIRLDEAAEALHEAIRVHPDHYQAHLHLAILSMRREQFDAALASVDEAVRLNPTSAPAHETKGLILVALERADAAIECFKTAAELEPHEPTFAYQAAMVECQRFQWSVAEPMLADLARKHPTFVEARISLALAKMEQGELAAAEVDLAQAEQIDEYAPLLAYARRRLTELKQTGDQ